MPKLIHGNQTPPEAVYLFLNTLGLSDWAMCKIKHIDGSESKCLMTFDFNKNKWNYTKDISNFHKVLEYYIQ